MKIGFIGTRFIPTQAQLNTLKLYIQYYANLLGNEFHHGDCVGADEIAAGLACKFGYVVIAHPPIDEKLRARYAGNKTILPAEPYLVRNRDIVDSVDLMIGVPRTDDYVQRSGTWSTLKYAYRHKKQMVAIGQNGQILDVNNVFPGRL